MEHLSKQQIILLAILISFVTSLATGIVTVSLMDQAPTNIARTITQVIQKTVATVATSATSSAAVAIAVDDQIADATAEVMPSLVRLRDGDQGKIVGIGIIVSKNGSIMADKNIIGTLNAPQAVFGNGASVPIAITRFQLDGDVAFLAPTRSISIGFKPVAFAARGRLGESVWSLSGTSTYELAQGMITELGPDTEARAPIIRTSIRRGHIPGAPLFDATGGVLGISTDSVSKDHGGSFYPIAAARDGIPK